MKKTLFYLLMTSLWVVPVGLMFSFLGLVLVTHMGLQQLEYRSNEHDALWVSNAQYVYYRGVANIWQEDPECAIYDEKLLYKPSSGCSFNNPAFSTTLSFDINGRTNPERKNHRNTNPVFVLGDSEAMGWGVNDNETFAYWLERDLKYPFYNLGVSSYGTVREIMRGISHPNFESASCIIIQYNNNDKLENSTFLAEGKLPQPTRKKFEQIQNVGSPDKATLLFVTEKTFDYLLKQPKQIFWFIGKNGMSLNGIKQSVRKFMQSLGFTSMVPEGRIRSIKTKVIDETVEDFMAMSHAIVFLEVLKKFPLLNDKTILVFGKKGFVSDLISNPNLPFNVIPLDMKLSMNEHRFFIDDHPNVAGHKQIASSITAEFSKNSRLRENCAVR